MTTDQNTRSVVAPTIRRLSVPIVLVWVAVAAISNIAVPNLEDVAKAHNVSLNTPAALSFQPCGTSARCSTNTIPTVRR